jgi:putative ABC transport system ATP-binding protein
MNTNIDNLDQTTSLLCVKNISHSFDYKLFSNINFNINNHESIAIIGTSGCGKSTFLNILSSLLKPDSGEVIYNNKNIYKSSEDQLTKIRRDDFGIVFQSHYLFRGFNAKENLDISMLLSNKDIDSDLLIKLKIDHVMNQDIGQLSGGQQQRLSIARVLTKKPAIIFADEPTGNLDKDTAEDVMNIFFEYIKNNNSALIIVTHEDNIANQCNHVYKFDEYKLKKIK